MLIEASYAYTLWASLAIFLLPRVLIKHSRRWIEVRNEQSIRGSVCMG